MTCNLLNARYNLNAAGGFTKKLLCPSFLNWEELILWCCLLFFKLNLIFYFIYCIITAPGIKQCYTAYAGPGVGENQHQPPFQFSFGCILKSFNPSCIIFSILYPRNMANVPWVLIISNTGFY